MKKTAGRALLCALPLAALLALSLTAGPELTRYQQLRVDQILLLSGKCLALFAAFSAAFGAALVALDKHPSRQKASKNGRLSRYLTLPLMAAFLFVCYCPALLAYCPGIVAYDASQQIMQGILGAYTTHHPLIHTLFLSGCVRLGGALGSYTLGAGLYSVLQMALLSLLLSYALVVLMRLGVGSGVHLMLLLCFALYPVHALMAISTTKDTLFAGAVLVLMLLALEAFSDLERFFASKRRIAIFVLLAALLCLLRNNGLYALLVLALGAVLTLRKYRVRVGALFLGVVLCYLSLDVLLTAALHAQKGSAIEALSVPVQQLARVAQREEASLSAQQREAIAHFMPLGDDNPYEPQLVDCVKRIMDKAVLQSDMAQFVSLWVQLGKQHPKAYIEAFLQLNIGSWYPLDTSYAHVYDSWGAAQHGYLQTKFQRHVDDERGVRIEQKSFLPWLMNRYEKFASASVQLDNPITATLFSPATMLMVLLACFCVGLYMGSRPLCIALLLPLGLWATLLLGPCTLTRYAYPLFLCAPVAMCLAGKICIQNTKN